MPGGAHLGSIRRCSSKLHNRLIKQVHKLTQYTVTERQCSKAYLLVLVLLQVARGHQALWVDVCGDWLNELRVRVHVLHLEEGQNVLDLQVVRAVGHGLAFGGQATRSHPMGVLFLLE